MALRVLLGDESSTIKKVFQLALQDYAVDVCSVAVGLDVVQATRQFKPDIIFCDILIQKKNGYEVAAELKSMPEFSSIPVVLMWSGFMELDQDKFQASRADTSLEKPFDVDTLRKIVNDLVPKTQSQRLSKFLSFPKLPDMLEFKGPQSSGPTAATGASPSAHGGLETVPPSVPSTKETWSMDTFDPMPEPELQKDNLVNEVQEEFTEVPLQTSAAPASAQSEVDEEEEAWSHSSLDQLHSKNQSPVVHHASPSDGDDDELDLDLSDEPESSSDASKSPVYHFEDNDETDLPLDLDEASAPPPIQRAHSSATSPTSLNLNQKELEKMVLEIAQPMIEEAIWKLLPEITERMVDKELKRLLSELNP